MFATRCSGHVARARSTASELPCTASPSATAEASAAAVSRCKLPVARQRKPKDVRIARPLAATPSAVTLERAEASSSAGLWAERTEEQGAGGHGRAGCWRPRCRCAHATLPAFLPLTPHRPKALEQERLLRVEGVLVRRPHFDKPLPNTPFHSRQPDGVMQGWYVAGGHTCWQEHAAMCGALRRFAW